MTETKRRLKVFLCHAHSDAAAVHDLFRYLRREGVNVWLDKESLLPGADWDLEIRKAVRESDVVVVCLSKQFNQAGYRQKEVRLALDTAMEQPEGEIFIIPARLEECDTLESLKKWHWVDLYEDGGRQRLIYALRARGESVGATLRANRVAPPIASLPKSQKAKMLTEPPAHNIDTKETQNLGKTETGSGIWIDTNAYIWRDSEMLGTLRYGEDYRLLRYLIAHKGKVCNYMSLNEAAYGESGGDIQATWIDNIVQDVRHLVEKDASHPQFIVEIPEVGYKLEY